MLDGFWSLAWGDGELESGCGLEAVGASLAPNTSGDALSDGDLGGEGVGFGLGEDLVVWGEDVGSSEGDGEGLGLG